MTNPQGYPSVRRLVVLGSTGSIGVNTLKGVEHLNASRASPPIQVVALAANSSTKTIVEQARQFHVPLVALSDAAAANEVRRLCPDLCVLSGPDAPLKLVEDADATDVVAAMVGSAGLPATLAAVRRGLRIGLANKETLVAAGALVTPLVRQHHAQLLPIDSEHSAIFQCLGNHPREAVERIVLTASGGPFRTADRETIQNATVEQALRHPTWNMGRKITIDSATMMNKALEIIEAHWLFDLPAEKIDVIIHWQSVVHSFVEFRDHSVLAQLGPPDMRTPIQYALTFPDRPAGCSHHLDWSTLASLEFHQPDRGRFPALGLAYDVIEAGGTSGAVLNAANEVAVAAFLDRKIRFGRIVELVAEALSAIPAVPADSLEAILAADTQARQFVESRLRGSTVTTGASGV